MLEYIRGTIAEKHLQYLVMEVHNIGYKIWISKRVFAQLPDTGMEFQLLLQPVYSENDQTLYGFTSSQDRFFFNLMLKVKGIGAKVSLSVLSVYEISELIDMVLSNKIKKICLVPGIGKKTAERMIVELKDTFQKHHPIYDKDSTKNIYQITQEVEDSSAVLMALGYSQNQIQRIMEPILNQNPGISTQEIIKKCLAQLSSL